MAERTQYAAHDPQFQAPGEKCPFFPISIVTVHNNIFVAPTAQAIFAGLTAHPAMAAQTESKLRISRNRSRQKRGPPFLLLAIS
ncbi:hypothetical protein [Edaphobacter dinghuensis]|nr:hypothetical protein [Edaphobacter dinghuensis]